MINKAFNFIRETSNQAFLRFPSAGAAFGLALVFLSLATGVFAAGGDVDPTFRAGVVGFDSGTPVMDVAVQPDGRIVIVGKFTIVNGVLRNRVARLNVDGTLDASFDPGTGANNDLFAVALQPDGKILIGGSFGNYNGATRHSIARLNADGSLDTSFVNAGSLSGSVEKLTVQPDGKILVAGSFTSTVLPDRIFRLNPDGTPDTSFNSNIGTGASNKVAAVELQPDKKILIGGDFLNINGDTAAKRIARLNEDGTLDTNFSTALGTGAADPVYDFAVLPDNKILVAGAMRTFNGATVKGLIRLHSTGAHDTTFQAGTANPFDVRRLIVEEDGKILIGGVFVFPGTTGNQNVARLNSNGSPDASFAKQTLGGALFNFNAIARQQNGALVVAGSFEKVGAAQRMNMAQFDENGNLDASFTPVVGKNETVKVIAVQPNGKILIGGGFDGVNSSLRRGIARLNDDGTLDESFNPGTGIEGNEVLAIAVQSDGKILIGGNFTKFNGVAQPNLARLNTDGSLDTSFTAKPNQFVFDIKPQPNGKIFIGGAFASITAAGQTNVARKHLALLDENNGAVDPAFVPANISSAVNSIAFQTDGKIIIAGGFSEVGGVTVNRIARLNTDGSHDPTFNSGGSGFSGIVEEIVRLSNDKIIAVGQFASFNGSGVNKYITRLNADGSADSGFNTNSGFGNLVNSIAVQTDGKIVVGGFFGSVSNISRNRVARLNADGSLDAGFTVGAGSQYAVYAVALQEDGRVLVGGAFDTFNELPRYGIVRLSAGGTKTWTGAANADFSNNANWLDGAAPSSADSVVIPASSPNSPVVSGAVSFTSLAVESGAELIVNGSVLVQGMNNDGEISGTGTLILAGASFVNNGTLSLANIRTSATGTKLFSGAGELVGNTLTIEPGATFRLESDHDFESIVNNGTLNITSRTVCLRGAGAALQGSVTTQFSTVIMEGAAAQTLPGSIQFNNLTINNPAGVSLSGGLSINGVLNLQNGLLNTGAFQLNMTGNASTLRTNGYVVGKIGKSYSDPQNFTFPLGTQNGYSPVSIQVTSGSPTITAEAVESNHPSLPASRSLRRYWKLSSPAGTFNANVIFNYLDSDVAGNEANYQITKINGSTQRFPNNCPAVCVDAAANTATINGVASFSDWTLSEPFAPTSAPAALGGRITVNNQPLAGVTVTARRVETGESFSAVTDAGGVYNLEDLPTGSGYTVLPQRIGFSFLPQLLFVSHVSERNDLNFSATRVSARRAANDFDGDGRSDIAVFRPENGTWYIWQSASNSLRADNWGLAGDELVAADYDGDGRTDVAVFRAGKWYIRQSVQNNALRYEEFGQAGDVPVAADFDGDNIDDLAVFRAGVWFIKSSRASGETRVVNFGLATDKPLAADFDGDSKADITVFRAGVWFVQQSSNGQMKTIHFGQAGDVPLTIDSNGDGTAEIAVFRPANGMWYRKQQVGDGFVAVHFGQNGDQASVGDFDGDGNDDLAAFRAGIWHLLENGTNYRGQQFGLPTDRPVVKR